MTNAASRKFPSRRALQVALALSVTLNLVIAGLVGGAFLGRGRDAPPETAMSDMGMGPFVGALPQEARRELAAEITERAGSLRENRRVLQDQFDTMLGLLRAESFEPARFAAIVGAQDDKLAERQQIGRELLFRRIGTMPVDERRVYADQLEERLKRGRKNWPRERQDGPSRQQDERH